MRSLVLHPTRKAGSLRHGERTYPQIATQDITVTDGPFTETKELLGSRPRPKPRTPVDR